MTARESANSDSQREQQRATCIEDVILDVLQRRQFDGHFPDEAVIAEHPDLMPELGEELKLAAELRQGATAEAGQNRATPEPAPASSRALKIRCPHCHSHIEILADTPFTDITCNSCGSHFSLAGEATETRATASVTTVGHFELVERLGLGGFGTVWKGRDTELDRPVAVKIPRKGQLNPDEVEKFLREARAAAQLNHPNIVAIHEVGRDGDTVYIVSDLVRGVSLSDRLTGQRLTAREAAELCRTIAEALHHAHQNGVIHRDLKPHNIVIDADGQPHLMDFGLARRESGEITMTVDGQVLGTPAYMSPEQARGEAHRADRRSDVYSLGVIFFELLTGELPFRGNARMLIHQVLHDEAPSPRKFNGRVPRDLETICLTCLEKDPQARYSTAEKLSAELGRFLTGEAIRSRPITAVGRTWRWCKRNSVVAGLGATVGCLLLFLAVAGSLIAIRQASLAQSAADEAERNRRLLYGSDMNVALQAWDLANVDRVRSLLERHIPAPNEEDSRGFEWYYLWRLCQRSVATPTFESLDSWAFSPDGRTLALWGKDVRLWDVATRQLRYKLAEATDRVVHAAYSPDGKTLVLRSQDKAPKLWDVATGELRHVLSGHSGLVHCVVFSPDGKVLASGGSDHTVRLWHADTGQIRNTLKGHGAGVGCVAFSPDGRALASGSGDHTLRLWDVESAELRYTMTSHTGEVTSLQFSPNGKWLLSWGRSVMLWDLQTGQLQYTLTEDAPLHFYALFSPNGDTLASWVHETSGKVKLLEAATGKQLHLLDADPQKVHMATFSPNGQTLATASLDMTVKVWDVATGQERFTLEGHTNWVWPLAFSPDGSTLASGSADNTVKLWNVETGEQIDTLKGHSGTVWRVEFSPDGKTLISRTDDGTLKLWDVVGQKRLNVLMGHTAPVDSVAFSSDGVLASGSRDNTIKLWDLETGQPKYTLQGHTDDVKSVVFSPSGNILASGGNDRTIKLWDVRTRSVRHTLKGHTSAVNPVTFSPDGQTLASGGADSTVRLWDVQTGKELDVLQGHSGTVLGVAFLVDGKTLASGSGRSADADSSGELKLWNVQRGQLKDTLQKGSWIETVVLSPDGRILASGGADRMVRLRDVQTGKTRIFEGYANWVCSVAFSPDGKTLASGSIDKTVKLWDVNTGEERATLKGHRGAVLSVAFSPDGRTLASGSDDGTVRLWRAASQKEVLKAKALLEDRARAIGVADIQRRR